MKLRNVLLLSVSALFGACAGAGDDPADTTEAFFQAMKDGDFEKGKELVTADSVKEFEGSNKDEKFEMADLTIGEAKVDGDKATVPTSFKVEGQKFSFDAQLRKEEGAWKIDAKPTMEAMMSQFTGAINDAMKGAADQLKDAKDKANQAAEDAMKKMQDDSK
ncbi:MAG: DUF4878 domain-containing protein [Planctomycetota bacterium]